MRSDIEAGDITAEDVLSVLPFNNTVDLVEISGEDIIKVDTKCRCIVFIFADFCRFWSGMLLGCVPTCPVSQQSSTRCLA